MTRKITTDELSQRILDLEIELENIRRVNSNIHNSRLYLGEQLQIDQDPLFNLISDGITVLDRNGIILFVNRTAQDQIGDSADNLTGRNISDVVTSIGSNTDYAPLLLQSFHDNTPESGDYLVAFARGKQRLMRLSFLLRADPLSSENHLWIVHRDITREKQLEEDLNSSRERINSMIESFPDVILNADLNGNILFIKPGIKGQNAEKIIGTSIYDYILPEDHVDVQSAIKQVFETGKETHCNSSGIGRDGIVRWYSARLIPIKHDGQVIAITINARDNSANRETEEQLKQSRFLLESILQSIPGSLAVLDKRFKVVASNKHGLLNNKPEFSKANYKCFQYCWYREVPCIECPAKNVFETGKPFKNEFQDKQDNCHKEVHIFPVISDMGQIRYVIEHIHDISLRKKSEEKILQADMKAEAAQQIKSDFLSKIHHELKTPMIGILGFSKLGLERYKKVTKEKLKTYFSTILDSGEKLQTLLNELLDLSHLESGQIAYDFQTEKLSMVTTIILNEVFTLLKKNQIEADYIIPDFPDLVLMDVDRIGVVIRTLVTNAVHISKPGSKIQLRISEEFNQVLFAVHDTGEAIPENELDSIFENFSRSKRVKNNPGGRVLGLAISRKIIADHKGKIWAENHPQEGSVFKFMLPKSD